MADSGSFPLGRTFFAICDIRKSVFSHLNILQVKTCRMFSNRDPHAEAWGVLSFYSFLYFFIPQRIRSFALRFSDPINPIFLNGRKPAVLFSLTTNPAEARRGSFVLNRSALGDSCPLIGGGPPAADLFLSESPTNLWLPLFWSGFLSTRKSLSS